MSELSVGLVFGSDGRTGGSGGCRLGRRCRRDAEGDAVGRETASPLGSAVDAKNAESANGPTVERRFEAVAVGRGCELAELHID